MANESLRVYKGKITRFSAVIKQKRMSGNNEGFKNSRKFDDAEDAPVNQA